MGKNRKQVKPCVIYYYDEEREYLYDKPYRKPGAKLITHAELEKAWKTNEVILIEGGKNGKDK